MEKLVVKKRDNIACWKVDAEGVCPNTSIELAGGITLLIKQGGKTAISSRSDVTFCSLFNPGKTTKLIGGKKPYDSCEVYAIDTSTDFQSEWGLAAGHAMKCKDPEFDVDANAIARGTYHYTIKDYFAFLNTFSFDKQTYYTRENVRDTFRDRTVNVVEPYLSSEVSAHGVDYANAHKGQYIEDIKFLLSRDLANSGLQVATFGIEKIDYEPAHLAHRETLKKAKIGVTIKGVVNDGRRDDISVDKEASEIDIGIINALKGNGKKSDDKEKDTKKVFCSRCGEANTSSDNYCCRCGEKLHK